MARGRFVGLFLRGLLDERSSREEEAGFRAAYRLPLFPQQQTFRARFEMSQVDPKPISGHDVFLPTSTDKMLGDPFFRHDRL